jgi:hypothetical protein
MVVTLPQDLVLQQVSINFRDTGGWLRFFPAAQTLDSPDLGVYLSQSVSQWFRAKPQFRPRCIIPITRGGDTVEFHVWYDQNQFPDLSGAQVELSLNQPGGSNGL